MHGLLRSLEFAAPNSIAYVFTDATARDFIKYREVLALVRSKQVTVNFMITGRCNATANDPEYLVYEKLASASDGQVFDLSRNTTKDVLVILTKALDPKFESIGSLNVEKAGSTTMPVKVDQSFSSLSVSLSGKNAALSVRNSKFENVTTQSKFSADNVQFVTFVVTDSAYTIEASAESAYTIRVGGISEVKFEFGFSINFTSEQSETSVQPLIGKKNILTIFISEPSLVKCLTKAVLVPANDENEFPEIEVNFDRATRGRFITDPVEIPTKMFKIKIHGYDKAGNVIERLISSGIESVDGCE